MMSHHCERRLSNGKAIGGWKLQVCAVVVTFSAICLTTTQAISQGRYSSYYRRRNNHNHPGTTTTTTITWPENPLPPTWDDTVEEPLPSTTSPAPADTLHSPFLDAYLPVTPSISPSSLTSHAKAFVHPHRRRVNQRNHQLLPRRTYNSRDSWRGANPRDLQKWSLQALEEDSSTPEDQDDGTLRWWVTNEPQLTLVAPETTLNQHRRRFRQPLGTTSISSHGNQENEFSSPNHLGMQQIERITPRAPRTTPRAPRTLPPASSSPTIHTPFPSPTTLAEDPAVLQAPHDLIRNNMDRQPRWFPLDRLFRMITVGADGECLGGEGRVGVCMLEGACRGVGGTPTTSCIFGYGQCCIAYKASCGLDVRTNRTYWVSPLPGKDNVVRTGGTCLLRVFKISPNICHIRLDLKRFKLVGPERGSCLRDRLVVSGHNINAFIPKICGENSGQHMYIDVDTVSGPTELSINTVGKGLDRSWEIEVSQIECDSPHRPPANCLQYYMGTQGSFSSFNYLPNTDSQYMNNQNYAICLRKEAGFCSVMYNNEIDGDTQPFEIVNFLIGPTGLATSVVPVGEAGVGLIQCPDDYLVMAGTRLCGDRLNDGSTNPQPTNNGPVTEFTNGPFSVQFTSNAQNTGRGFRLHFQQYPC